MSDTKEIGRRPKTPRKVPGPRIARERATISAMMRLYCRDHHAPDEGLCDECDNLLAYALQRLGNCPFEEAKPVCNLCEVHCYSKKLRDRVRTVMRYAGPRMLLRHPLLSFFHVLDKRRPSTKLPEHRKR